MSQLDYSATKHTVADDQKILAMNGSTAGYIETDELATYTSGKIIAQTVTDGDTTHAPSGDAVDAELTTIRSSISQYGLSVDSDGYICQTI